MAQWSESQINWQYNEGFLDTDTQKNESMASITAICIIFIFFLSLPRYSRSESFSRSRPLLISEHGDQGLGKLHLQDEHVFRLLAFPEVEAKALQQG